jgi:energy-coupling factor transporter ATP-binding protein EcfA2
MGEKQRIQIVMALLKNKPIMLLDEAFSHIDIKMTKIILEYLSNMKDKIILLTIHNRSDVLKNCTNIITIKNKMINYESKNDENSIQLLNKNEYVNKKILKKIMFPNVLLFFKIIIFFISSLTAFFINVSSNSVIDNTVKFYNNQTDIKYKYNMIRNKEIFNMNVSDYEKKLLKNPFFRIPPETLELNEIEELKKNNPNYKNIYYSQCMNIYFEYKNIDWEYIDNFYFLIDESVEDDLIITDTTTKDLFKETELNGYVFNVLGKDIGFDYYFRKIILNFKTFTNLEFHSYMTAQHMSNKDLYNYKIIEGKDVSNDNDFI